MSSDPSAPRHPWRALRALARWAVRAAVLAGLVGWFLLLRPQSLGGPAGYIVVAGQSMEPTLYAGTLVMVVRQPEYTIGDIVAYRITGDPIAEGQNVIHRIVGGTADTGFVLEGDNNTWDDPWHPTSSSVIGTVVFVMPGAAPVLVLLRSPLLVASLAAGIAIYFVLGWRQEPATRMKPANRARPSAS